MAEKVTKMVLKVDLQCCRCYKKVKKVLCKFPQIRDQVYDEKNNKVTITVVCCCPEKIRDKICCKGGESIKSIEILPPPPPPPKPEKPKEPEKKPEKPKEPEKKPEKPKEPEKKPEKPKEPEKKPEKPKEPEKKPEKPKEPEKKPEKPKEPEKPKPQPPAPPPIVCPPIGSCCTECFHGHVGGPCYFGVPPPRPCYETYGRPVYDSWGGGGYKYCYVSRGDCFSEENPQACSIM